MFILFYICLYLSFKSFVNKDCLKIYYRLVCVKFRCMEVIFYIVIEYIFRVLWDFYFQLKEIYVLFNLWGYWFKLIIVYNKILE